MATQTVASNIVRVHVRASICIKASTVHGYGQHEWNSELPMFTSDRCLHANLPVSKLQAFGTRYAYTPTQ
eukprot:5932652-Amphidinium_carterae.1